MKLLESRGQAQSNVLFTVRQLTSCLPVSTKSRQGRQKSRRDCFAAQKLARYFAADRRAPTYLHTQHKVQK